MVVCYAQNGRRIEKDAAQFLRDVNAVRSRMRDFEQVVVTLAGNSYEHLVYMVACFLERKTLCPVNPFDGKVWTEKKLAQLNLPYTLVPQEKMSLESIGDARPYSLEPYDPKCPMVLTFTSGSTGTSKIVQQEESAILSNVDALMERHRLHRPTVIATPLPIFHVNALEFSFLSSLLSGNTFVLYEQFHLQQLVESIARDRIDILSVVPHLLKVLYQRCRGDELKRLLYITTAAAPMAPSLARDVVKNFPVRVLQGYGLSEAVNFSTLMPADLSNDEYKRWMNEGLPSIGTELRGNTLFVRDDGGRELVEGEIGEICIRGWNVMKGYLHDDNADVFKDGFLHTGDLGYFKRDAHQRKFFFITGRKKDVIKRNATTIPLAEVDQILASLNLDAIAVGFEHDVAGEELAAVLQSPTPLDPEILRKIATLLEENIPAALRPRVLAWTSRPLRTASGKPQRWKHAPTLCSLRSTLLTQSIHTLELELS